MSRLRAVPPALGGNLPGVLLYHDEALSELHVGLLKSLLFPETNREDNR